MHWLAHRKAKWPAPFREGARGPAELAFVAFCLDVASAVMRFADWCSSCRKVQSKCCKEGQAECAGANVLELATRGVVKLSGSREA